MSVLVVLEGDEVFVFVGDGGVFEVGGDEIFL